jgi:hypothetical protein
LAANTRSPSVRPGPENPGMDRARLKAWLDAGLSLPQIGALTNRDPSTVGYWVQKYGLTANGKERFAPRGGLTREQLEPLVERGATLQEMADELDRSMSTIRYWLDRFGLESRNTRRGPRPAIPQSGSRKGNRPRLEDSDRALLGPRRDDFCDRGQWTCPVPSVPDGAGLGLAATSQGQTRCRSRRQVCALRLRPMPGRASISSPRPQLEIVRPFPSRGYRIDRRPTCGGGEVRPALR